MVAPPGQGCLRERQGLCPQELPEPCRVRLTDQSFLWDSCGSALVPEPDVGPAHAREGSVRASSAALR